MKEASSSPLLVSLIIESWFAHFTKGNVLWIFPSFSSFFFPRLTTDLCVAWKLHSSLDASAILFSFIQKYVTNLFVNMKDKGLVMQDAVFL